MMLLLWLWRGWLVVSAVALLALGVLTVRPALTLATWKMAILAGEFGHYLAVLALGLAVGAALGWGQRGGGLGGGLGGGGLTVLLQVGVVLALLVAAGLLLRPAMLAAGMTRTLAEELARTWGPEAAAGARWDWGRLWLGRRVAPVAVETRVFAGGPDAGPGARGGRQTTREVAAGAEGTGGNTGPELALDFYRPPQPRPSRLCVVVIHGGGWDGGDRGQLPELNHRLARQGYAVAAVSYRLAPAYPWPAQREDVLAAVAWLKAQAAELGIAPDRLVLLGRSAGGQIATAVAYGQPDPAIRGVAAWYAVHDLHFVWSIAREDDVLNSVKLLRQYLGGSPEGERRARYDSASAQGLVVPGVTPPTLLVHGQLDQLVWHRHSERLTARLREAGVPQVFLSLPWATHACDFNLDGPSGQLMEAALLGLLAEAER